MRRERRGEMKHSDRSAGLRGGGCEIGADWLVASTVLLTQNFLHRTQPPLTKINRY